MLTHVQVAQMNHITQVVREGGGVVAHILKEVGPFCSRIKKKCDPQKINKKIYM